MPGKKEIIKILEEIAGMMDFKGENPFKVNAFRNGANSIRRLSDDLDTFVKEKKLGDIKGIGKGLQAVIYDLYDNGESSLYNELKKEVPDGILDLLKIRGLGAKKLKVLNKELGISTIGELEYACKENRLALLKGFGEATQKKILNEIEKLKVYSKYLLLSYALEIGEKLKIKLEILDSVSRVEISGELRRRMEIISGIDLVLLVKNKDKFEKNLKKLYEFDDVEGKYVLHTGESISVNLYHVKDPAEFEKKLFLTTGSEDFLEEIVKNKKEITGENEDEIFSRLEFPFIMPEMREKEYFGAKEKYRGKSNLNLKDFKGLLHFHTVNSDGRNTLGEMVAQAEKLGFEYCTVCNHSKSAFYANGLTPERVLLENKEVRDISSKSKLPAFHGIESDILQNGDLDYDKEILKSFDFIVASVHSIFNLSEEEMTKRIIKAVENPFTDLLGHPSGRLLLSRDPYKFDTKKIIDACVSNDVAIEINANPRRLDLDWRWIYYAREKGCKFSINPDAHSVEDIQLIKYGIMVARKGGLRPEEVINCYDVEKFKKFLNRKVTRNLN